MAGIIKISILANARKAIAEMRQTGDAATKMGKKTKKAGSGMKGLAVGAGVLGGVALVGRALKDGVTEATKFEDATNQTTSALKANKNLYGLTAAKVQENSAALENLVGAKFDENDITKATNKLITAGVASQDLLNRGLKVSAGVAARTGKDIGGVSTALSKALANPSKAAGVLRKAGVELTAAQEKGIKAMVKSGDTAGAQGAVIAALEGKYQGAAEAAGVGLSADLGRATDAMDDAKREIAQKLMPTLSNLATKFAKELPGAIDRLMPIIDKLLAFIGSPFFPKFVIIVGAIALAMKAFNVVMLINNIIMMANPIALIVLAVIALIVVIVLIATKTKFFQTVWKAVWTAVKVAALAVWNFLKQAFKIYIAIILKYWAGIKALWSIAVNVFKAIVGAVRTAINWVKERIALFIAAVKIIWARIMQLVTKAKEFRDKIIGIFKAWLTWMRELPGKIITGLLDGLKAGWKRVTQFFDDAIDLIPDGIKSALGLGSPSKVMRDIGGNIVAGLAIGIADKETEVARAMASVAKTAQSGLSGVAASVGSGTVEVTGGAFAAGAGNVYTINVSLPVGTDPADAGRAVVRVIEAYERRTGKRRLVTA